jgi:hypothetical protein
MQLKDVAVEISAHTTGVAKELNPATIEVILEVLKMIVSCYKNMSVKSLNKPSLFQRWQLRRCVKVACDDKGFYQLYGDTIYQSILKYGSDLTESKYILIVADLY